MTSENEHAGEVPEEDEISQKIGESIVDLVRVNWPLIESAWGDRGEQPKMSITAGFTLVQISGGIEVETTIGFSKKYKDSREDFIDRSGQEALAFE